MPNFTLSLIFSAVLGAGYMLPLADMGAKLINDEQGRFENALTQTCMMKQAAAGGASIPALCARDSAEIYKK